MKLFIRSIWPSSPRWLWPQLKSNHKSQPNMEDTNLYRLCVSLCVCVCGTLRTSTHPCACVFMVTSLHLCMYICMCVCRDAPELRFRDQAVRGRRHEKDRPPPGRPPFAQFKLDDEQKKDVRRRRHDQPYCKRDPASSIGLTTVLLFCAWRPPVLSLWIM